ncbi:hypothetical protein [Bacteroides oleiciplenus]|uniref:hypothetical protein n=1 Tax=Bacteroides oleiciplenus TaxID=626931 RepID=UPI0026DB4114|nr:hypothetical protein [Bacteroides oleiciplenus]
MNEFKLKMIIPFISIYLLVYTGKAFGQEPTTLSLLTNKEWIMQFPEKQNFSYKLTYDTHIQAYTFIYSDGGYVDKVPYYLSDKVVSNFDSAKVGKCDCGKYIVTLITPKNEKKRVLVYEILELSNHNLILKSLNNNSVLQFKVE